MIEVGLHDVYLALGSNLGDRDQNIRNAIENINERVGQIICQSAFYVTAPVGFDSEHLFLNAACRIRTPLLPVEVLEYTQVIEREMGRRSKSYNRIYSDRVIDIDILFYEDLQTEYPHLVLPHPHLHERLFVLQPLVEIARDFKHPVLNKTIKELHDALNRNSEV